MKLKLEVDENVVSTIMHQAVFGDVKAKSVKVSPYIKSQIVFHMKQKNPKFQWESLKMHGKDGIIDLGVDETLQHNEVELTGD